MQMPSVGEAATPHLSVSPEQQRAYEQTATAVVDRVIAEFLALTSTGLHGDRQWRVDPRNWKAFKKHETIQIYRARERLEIDAHARKEAPTGGGGHPLIDWTPMAQLLGVGTLLGSLDDAMYGAVTPTEFAMATRSVYIKDECTQHHILADFHVPTYDEPFRYLGIKWCARSASIATLVKPRETLYLEASGYRDVPHPNGGGSERIGFVVYHSVELPEVPKRDGMVRARISACYLFRQASPGVVQVHATMRTDGGGHLPHKLAALAGAAVMIAVSRVVECALKKKLAWMVTRRARSLTDDHETAFSPSPQSASSCMQCARSLSTFSTLTECLICQARVCSRCITSRRLVLGRSRATMRRKTISMCKSCISTANHGTHAAEVAAYEYVKRGGSGSVRRLPSATPSSGGGVDADSDSSSHTSHELSARSNVTTQSMLEDRVTPLAPLTLVERPNHALSAVKIIDITSGDEQIDSVAVPADDKSQTVPAQWAAHQTPKSTEKVQWWMRINELRLQAEETYQLAREQTISMEQAAARVATK